MRIIENNWRKPIEHKSAEEAVPSACRRCGWEGGELERLRDRVEELEKLVGRLCDAVCVNAAGMESVLGSSFTVTMED